MGGSQLPQGKPARQSRLKHPEEDKIYQAQYLGQNIQDRISGTISGSRYLGQDIQDRISGTISGSRYLGQDIQDKCPGEAYFCVLTLKSLSLKY